jgi:hypothetical protein
LDSLMAMSDETFAQVKATGTITDDKVKNPALLAVRSETINRNLGQATTAREQNRLVEEKRKENERLAELERQKQVEEWRKADEENRREDAQKQRDEANAKIATRNNPPSVNFKDFVDFPENYMGRVIKIESVWLWGNPDRHKAEGIFGVTIQSRDGKIVSGGVLSSDLVFVTSEQFGGFLDTVFAANVKVSTNLYCEVTKIGDTPVAKLYRVETLNLNGDIQHTYNDK